MRRPLTLALVCALALAPRSGARAAGDRPADEIRPRVEHHLAEAEQIARQLEAAVAGDCPRLASREEWDAYLDGHVDRVVTLVAHLEQAWIEAKQTADKDVRREAKAPRRRVDRAQQLVQKLQACAHGHGASLSPGAVWQRVEREAPQRQREVALPR